MASRLARAQLDPARLESATIIVGQRGGGSRRTTGQEAAPDQDLEPIADAQDQASTVVKPAKGVSQGMTQSRGQDPACARSSP